MTIEGTASRAPRGFSAALAAIAGFSLLYAVCISFFYVNLLPGMVDRATLVFECSLNGSMVLGCVAFAVFAWRGYVSPRGGFWLAVIGHAAMAVALVALFVPYFDAAGLSKFVSAGVFAGFGMALSVPHYFSCLVLRDARETAFACGVVFLVGMVLNVAMGLLPSAAVFASNLLALVGSVCCLIYAKRANRQDGSDYGEVASDGFSFRRKVGFSARPSIRESVDTFLVPVVCTFALSVVYRILDVAAVGMGQPSAVATVVSQCGGILAALVFLLYIGVRKSTSMSLLFNVVFGVLATGILLLPFAPAEYAALLNACAAAGWKLVMLSLFVLAAITYAGNRSRLLANVALAYALPRFGLLVGVAAALLFGIEGVSDFMASTAVAFFLLYVVLMAIWLANYHERKQIEHRAVRADREAQAAAARAEQAEERLLEFARNQNDAMAQRCADIAKNHGLTQREESIFALLAQGRDVSFVAEELCLAKNTVKSYQKSIYAKLGIHSKQAIIDMVRVEPDGK